MSVSYIPEGYNNVSPYLMVKDIDVMMDFLIEVFEAEELERMKGPEGWVRHGEVRIGDSVIMMGRAREDFPEMESMIHIYTADVNAVYDRAMAAGATSLMEPTDQFYGNREAGIKGPLGNQWWMATRIEKLSDEELEKRAKTWGQ